MEEGPTVRVLDEELAVADKSITELGIGEIGDIAEDVLEVALRAREANFASQQRVTATLKIGDETTTFVFVPDFLVEDSINPVVNNKLQLIYDESNATITDVTSGLDQLSDNQAVVTWAISQRGVPGSNVEISFSVVNPNAQLQGLLDTNVVTEIDIIGVKVHPFKVIGS